MKKPSMRAALGMALMAASAAHAGTTTSTYDFDGFTISFSATEFWQRGGVDYNESEAFSSYDLRYDAATGRVESTDVSGVVRNSGAVSFSTAALPALESLNGSAPAAAGWSFSYAITAKPDWQLVSAYAYGSQTGEYLQFKGGSVTVSGTGQSSSVGGSPDNGSPIYSSTSGAYLSPTGQQGAMEAGTWTQRTSQYMTGNNTDELYKTTYDADGSWLLQNHNYLRTDVDPMTSVIGRVSLDLSASTGGAHQIAYLSGGPASLTISATAARVSPVPEPEAYAMVLASLGVLGVLARRKAKHKDAAGAGAAAGVA